MMSSTPTPRLTSLSHGGGCGCKIAPGMLADLLKGSAPAAPFAQLLVGMDTADDAAVYQLNEHQALVATTDFFMPILALALLAGPIKMLPPHVIGEILRGGEAICAEAGIPIAGGHSIDSVEPIYGLAAIGLVHPRHLKRNSQAQAGDALILGKPLGVGILSAALKKGQLPAADYRAMIDTTTRLNRAGPELATRRTCEHEACASAG